MPLVTSLRLTASTLQKKKKHQDQDDGDVGDIQTSIMVDNDDIGETRAGEV